MASSPVIVGDTVIVQVETDDDSFAAGIDIENGETRWKLDRPHRDNWTTPVVLKGADPAQDVVALQGSQGLIGVRPKRANSCGRTPREPRLSPRQPSVREQSSSPPTG
jgi:hypothetical protein